MADGDCNLQFRIATLHDASKIQQLVQSAFRAHDSRRDWVGDQGLASRFRIEVDQVRDSLAKPDTVILVAHAPLQTNDKNDASMVASIEVSKRGAHGEFGRLSVLAVDQWHQRGGIGRQVLAYAEDYCQQTWGAAKFSLDAPSTRKALIEWYMRRGYRKTGETSTFPRDKFGNLALPEDICFVELEKDLDCPRIQGERDAC